MIKKLSLLLVSGSTLLVGMQMNNAKVDAVTSVAHGGGAHVSVHAATPHATPSVHTTPSISRSTGTHSSPSISPRSAISNPSRGTITHSTSNINTHINSGISSSSLMSHNAQKPLTHYQVESHVLNQLPQTHSVYRSISRAESTATYHGLTRPAYQTDYVFWRTYCDTYYTRPMFGYYYPWMPFWLWHSSDNKESIKVRENAKKYHMKWIKVNNQTIAVPDKIYKIIKVGDEVELTDNTHIKINGKIYSR